MRCLLLLHIRLQCDYLQFIEQTIITINIHMVYAVTTRIIADRSQNTLSRRASVRETRTLCYIENLNNNDTIYWYTVYDGVPLFWNFD